MLLAMQFRIKQQREKKMAGSKAPTVKTIEEFMTRVQGLEGREILYRGLADAAWRVEASGYRRARESKRETTGSKVELSTEEFLDYIRDLLRQARGHEFHLRGNRKLSDLELLAQLQHGGAATCLMDFTENPFIALWFACLERGNKDGKVVAVAVGDHAGVEEITPENFTDPLEKFFDGKKLWRWRPPQISNRIIAQHSSFVFGGGEFRTESYETFVVAAATKQAIRGALSRLHGITEEHLFSDFAGFCVANAHSKFYRGFTAEKHFARGLVWDKQRKFREAVSSYSRAIELGFKNAEVYNKRGLAKLNTGDARIALSSVWDFSQAIALDDQYADAYYNRGVAKSDIRDFLGAVADFDQAIELEPKFAEAYYSRGRAKAYLHNISRGEDYVRNMRDAVADYDRAIALGLNRAEVYYNRGVAKSDVRDFLGAVADFDQAIVLDPKFTEAYYHRGSAKIDVGDHLGAISDTDQAIALGLKTAYAYLIRGLAKAKRRDFRGALADCDQAILLDPRHFSAYNIRGHVKRALGDETGAKADFKEANRLDPDQQVPKND